MAHVVTLKTDPTDASVVYLCTPRELASTMGAYGPARFVGDRPPIRGASYAIAADDVPSFRVFAANRGVTLADMGPPARADRPGWMERPLPECAECGQPRARYSNPAHCPQCGEAWVDA